MGQNNPGGGGGGGNPGGGGAPKSRRKPILDSTNLWGFVIWASQALLTSFAIASIFLTLPAGCVGSRGEVVSACTKLVATGADYFAIIVGSLVFEMIVTTIANRASSIIVVRFAKVLDWITNAIGWYWLLCVQIGIASAAGLRDMIQSIARNMTLPTLAWAAGILILSVGLGIVSDELFKAKPKTSAGSGSSGAPKR